MKSLTLLVAGVLMYAVVGLAEDAPLKVQLSFEGPQVPDNMVCTVVGTGGVGGNAIYSKDAGINQTLFELAQKSATICIKFSADEGDFVVSDILPLDECK